MALLGDTQELNSAAGSHASVIRDEVDAENSAIFVAKSSGHGLVRFLWVESRATSCRVSFASQRGGGSGVRMRRRRGRNKIVGRKWWCLFFFFRRLRACEISSWLVRSLRLSTWVRLLLLRCCRSFFSTLTNLLALRSRRSRCVFRGSCLVICNIVKHRPASAMTVKACFCALATNRDLVSSFF